MSSYLIRRGLIFLSIVLLAGCNTVVLNPSGDVAQQQGRLIVVSTVLMLIVIVPVIALTVLYAWHYRQSNTAARYEPDWHHSTQLELIIWGAPLLIIIALGLVTWVTTHTLDPYRKLSRIDAQRPIPEHVKPLTVEVVALDWKWLFIYPEQGIATVNELAAPVNVPINFKITASSFMNSFYIPALAGQIYAMPSMQTALNAVINKPGEFEGFSANYSGHGFSDMRFKFHGLSNDGFDAWVKKVKAGGGVLERDDYVALEKPSIKDPVRYYKTVDATLYHAILNRCVKAGQVCIDRQMATDMNVEKGKGAETEKSAALDVPASLVKVADSMPVASQRHHE
ncbi:MAG: ubiquinol oxidase subunit II [Herbaspirillum sp.]